MKKTILFFLLSLSFTSYSQHYKDIRVVRVLDGDTIDVVLDGEQKRIRIAEIDCPEKGQPYSNRATQFTKDFTSGNIVNLKIKEKDRYGRYIGYISVEEKDLSTELVKNGYAWVYRFFSTSPLLLELEDTARKSKLGLWAEPNPIEPRLYRKSK